ncbi:hypothetical protein FIU97_19410 (plasmid) [Roseivivax sp. THAF40]|uniref:hypothetical protein n=1 Tax=unclassified Roseivivax TaxID=2639302 RepID=UPI0012AA2EDB|nr:MULTISPECIES: hypothetical protein [unclassified Roseivivax]QFS84862.1 hypothetical protein FIV09_18625 [Roseivivax sp. THAF197b]QFT48764.1 hypothetical protein FIU97_19410 [Roseivivax sp. THAF40]
MLSTALAGLSKSFFYRTSASLNAVLRAEQLREAWCATGDHGANIMGETYVL